MQTPLQTSAPDSNCNCSDQEPLPRINGLTELIQSVATQIGMAIQRKRAEELMRHSHQQLRALAGRLQVVREEERTRIAREIHDVLAQELTRLRIDLGWLKHRVGAVGQTEVAASLLEKLDASINTTNTAITTVSPRS